MRVVTSFVGLLVVAACSAPSSHPSHVTAPAHTEPTAPVAAVPPTPRPPGPLLVAGHAGPIVRLALAVDSHAVLSQDANGGTRLWPSLDGKTEPRVVDLPNAKQLVLAHRDTGYTAVARDESGGLYIAHLDGEGRALGHATVGVDPPIAGIAASSRGIVAWRADHHVLLLDGDGKVQGDLAAEPQQRIATIAAAGDRALAILEVGGDGTRRVRQLTLSPRLAWGAWIEQSEAPFAGSVLALAPDGKHYAVGDTVPTQAQVTIYDAKGARTTRVRLNASQLTLAFYDSDRLAVGSQESGISWVTTEPNAPLQNVTPSNEPSDRLLFAAGGGLFVSAREAELLLMTRERTQFLGYGVSSVSVTDRGPAGSVVLAAERSVQLDASLAPGPPIDLATPTGGSVDELVWVGDDDYLVEAAAPDGGFQLALVTATTGKATVLRDGYHEAHVIAYEPGSQVVTLSFGRTSEVARLDRKARTLATITPFQPKDTYEEIVVHPLAPSAARGNSLVQVTLRDKPVARWIANAAAPRTAAASLTLGGAFLAADAGGHVYAWQPGKTLQVGIYTDGKLTGSLPSKGPVRLFPDVTGARVVEITGDTVTLYQDGKQAWSTPLFGMLDALWLTDGALAITSTTGIVRLDAATGHVQAARCGWDFGLAERPHAPAPRVEPVCTQLPQRSGS